MKKHTLFSIILLTALSGSAFAASSPSAKSLKAYKDSGKCTTKKCVLSKVLLTCRANANLTGATLTQAYIVSSPKDKPANCKNMNFSKMNADNVWLGFYNDFSGSKFNGAVMNNARIDGVILKNANFSGAKLAGASFLQSNLSNANLSKANLSGVRLTQANLSGANLTGADMTGAILMEANLNGARITQKQLDSARSCADAKLPGKLKCKVKEAKKTKAKASKVRGR